VVAGQAPAPLDGPVGRRGVADHGSLPLPRRPGGRLCSTGAREQGRCQSRPSRARSMSGETCASGTDGAAMAGRRPGCQVSALCRTGVRVSAGVRWRPATGSAGSLRHGHDPGESEEPVVERVPCAA
jgi:hypothetical protein